MSMRMTGLALLLATMGLVACGGGSDGPAASSSGGGGGGVAGPSSLGADGWANSQTDKVTGGDGADAAHTYTVTNRNELIQALYGGGATINADGSFSGTLDTTKKIIYIKGTINLSMNKALVELVEADYVAASVAAQPYDFAAYVAAYKPSVWNADPANWDTPNNRPKAVSGAQETARAAASANQGKIVKIPVSANTSLLGLGADAKIIRGQLSLGDGADNVVIRNIAFEDAFDYFPVWSPTDSFSLTTPAQAGCQAAYVDATTGPQMCPGGRWNSNYDLITLNGGKRIWIDHCSFSDGSREDHTFASVFDAPHVGVDYFIQHHDGAVDITNKSDFVTLSYNHIKNHDKTHLIGSSDTVNVNNGWGALSVTLHHNYYENAGQRLPRVRMGKVHLYNNYYSGQIGYLGAYAPVDGTYVPPNRHLYGMGIGYLAKIYSENNVFDITSGNSTVVDDTVTFYTWHKASPSNPATDSAKLDYLQKTYFYDSGTLLNGAGTSLFVSANAMAASMSKPVLEDTSTFWTPATNYTYTPDAANTVKAKVMANAGAGKL
ncbi:MAG: hypothetical protein REI94_09930 [Moraxellaceae bacterium]|nr:hypothetical protein [Moraxellaceae bacterium]